MSLSTSSFKTEAKVVALVLLVLLGCELVVRTREQYLSLDLKHIGEIPAISQNIAAGQGLLRVLFIGNSMTRYGVDTGTFEREMQAQGIGPLRVEKVFPDATGLPDWYYAFKHYFVDAGHLPDVLIVSFAARDLQDDYAVEPTRLARYYSSSRDIPEVFSRDVLDFDGRVEFLLSSISSSFANRTRVRTRVLDALVPDYRETAQQLNRDMNRGQSVKAASAPHTYVRLERLIQLASQRGVRVIFVAMPLREAYTLDPLVRKTVEEGGMTFVDCRDVAGLGRESYLDEMHLKPEGAAVYSQFLAHQLAGEFPRTSHTDERLLVTAGK
jgi:hypothetical protein